MFRKTIVTGITTILTLSSFQPAHAQGPERVESVTVKELPRRHLSGPRFGFTTFTSDVADLRNSVGKEAIMSQFGWQFETQIVSMTDGNQALMEWVFLVGGGGAGRAQPVPLLDGRISPARRTRVRCRTEHQYHQ
jgi:hypothetical protein